MTTNLSLRTPSRVSGVENSSILEVQRRRLRILEKAEPDALVIHEIYTSVQGESSYMGLPCTFIRTSGCPLRCSYCDTPHAFVEGESMGVQAIIDEVVRRGVNLVEVTGGEPLVQPNVHPLMRKLCDLNYTVMLETSGAYTIKDLDPRVVCILDLKCPSSREAEANDWSNIEYLRAHHEVKFVCGDRADFDWAVQKIQEYGIDERASVLMSTVFGKLAPKELVQWTLDKKLRARVQLQSHKYIWPPDERGV